MLDSPEHHDSHDPSEHVSDSAASHENAENNEESKQPESPPDDHVDEEMQEEDLDLPTEEQDPLLDTTRLKPILERRDRSLKELLESMDEFAPIIPDAVTDFYLSKAGFHTTDQRVKRLLALATQKFVTDIATDAYQFARIRSQAGGQPQQPQGGAGRRPGMTQKTVLTAEALSAVLADYGIDSKRPDFYR